MGFNIRESLAIGFGMNARGAMEIILGLLALQAGLIGERMFVALIIMAMTTSIVAGPAMQWIMGHKRVARLADFLNSKAFLPLLQGRTRDEVIHELSATLATVTGLSRELIAGKVLAREKTMATGIGRKVAIPHARMDGLSSPAIAIGYSKDGIDFDAPDGLPARVILLVLTPKEEFQRQLQILAEVGKLFRSERAVERVLRTQSFVELLALLKSEEKG
jgi:mannitol/fructose-specific phosphotransferase system IIA component (Ntr-type)